MTTPNSIRKVIGFDFFDQNFVEEVAEKINFHIRDYLFIDTTEE